MSSGNVTSRVVSPARTDTNALAETIAAAFHPLAPSRYLVPDPQKRHYVLPLAFQLDVIDTFEHGTAVALDDNSAVALWISHGEQADPEPTHDPRIAAIAGRETAERYHTFYQALHKHHPTGHAHDHLAILAVRPDQQHRGFGSTLLDFHHAYLDAVGMPAYLEAASLRLKAFYRRHGYVELDAPIILPDGTQMHPMWREPLSSDGLPPTNGDA